MFKNLKFVSICICVLIYSILADDDFEDDSKFSRWKPSRLSGFGYSSNDLSNVFWQSSNDLMSYAPFKWFQKENIHRIVSSGCNCLNFTCSCCSRFEIEKIKFNDTACVNMTYLSDDIGIEITFSINNDVLLNRSVSVRNPPLMCFGIPYLEDGAKLCLRLYDIEWRNHSYSGCLDLVAFLFEVKVANIKIGCFKMGNNTQFQFEQQYHISYLGSQSNNQTDDDINRELEETNKKFNQLKDLFNRMTNEMEFFKSFSFSPFFRNVYTKTGLDRLFEESENQKGLGF